MSAVAALYNVPSTPEELGTWAFAHAAHHRDIIRLIYERGQVKLVEYPLDPMPTDDLEAWTYQHQQMHQDFDSLLGISGYDLTDVDWKDRNQVAAWIFLNASEHYQAANTLELG